VKAGRILLLPLALAAGLVAVYGVLVRPRISRWGATDEEVDATLPGDELQSPYGYRPVSTRAITPGELLHHYMESGMLMGIKERVEARPSSGIPVIGVGSR
jgi:hypothetical protein